MERFNYLIERLIKRRREIVPNPALIAKSDRFNFEKVDICDRDELDCVFTEFNPMHVMHLVKK